VERKKEEKMWSRVGRIVLWALVVAGIGPSVRAAVIYSSGGFEQGAGLPPRFVPGVLTGQDFATWVEQGPAVGGGTAVVQTAVVSSGSQAVRVDRTNADKRYWANFADVTSTSIPPLERFLSIDWDMNVSRSSVPGVPFGPFFGIEAYDPNSRVISAAGVDATTGDVLYEAPGTGILTETGVKVPFGSFQKFRLVLDYNTRSFEVFVNDALAVKAPGFVNSSVSGFSDADIAALAAQAEPPTQTGTAYFDNYVVSTSAVPEPGSVGLVAVAVAGMLVARPRPGN